MELPIEPSSKSEIQAVVWFSFVEKVPKMETWRHLVVIYSENVMLVQMIRK